MYINSNCYKQMQSTRIQRFSDRRPYRNPSCNHHGRSCKPFAFISFGASTTTLPYDHITSGVTMLFGPSDDIAYGDNASI